MDNLEKTYNEMVGITLINLYSLAEESGAVNFCDFAPYDEEHLYLLHVAMASYSIHHCPIRFNLPRRKRKQIAKMFAYPAVIDWRNRAKKERCFDPNELLDFMRPVAMEKTQDPLFWFGDIYREFYRKEEDNA